jgi:cystathionine beta-synthase
METSLARLRDVFAEDNVAVVKEGEKVVAIVTKIDLIEYLASRMT